MKRSELVTAGLRVSRPGGRRGDGSTRPPLRLGPSAGAGTVPVINRATCNGTDHCGCGATPPVITVGGKPGPVATDQATDTAYVASGNATNISVTNGDTCNATSHVGMPPVTGDVR